MTKRLLYTGIMLIFAFGLCRAAKFGFQDKETAIRQEERAKLTALGITRDAAKAKYPTPEIAMVNGACLLPGGTGEVVVRGKFAPGTRFIVQNDSIQVLKETVAGNEYRATVKAAAVTGPQSAGIIAIGPLTGLTVRRDDAVNIGGRYEFTLNAANGWKVVARAGAGNGCATGSSGLAYELQFFRNGEAAPFEKRPATLHYSMYDTESLIFNVSQRDAATEGGMEAYMNLMKKMSDPNLTDAQREALMKSLEGMQKTLAATMTRMTDPAEIAKRQQQQAEFGCERISLALQGSGVKGQMRCAPKVGTRLDVTGTITLLSK